MNGYKLDQGFFLITLNIPKNIILFLLYMINIFFVMSLCLVPLIQTLVPYINDDSRCLNGDLQGRLTGGLFSL